MDVERKLMVAVERMPAFPRSVQRMLELTRSPTVEPKAIVAVIEKDPVMTARILRVINSAFYALPNKISGVGHAVVLLGINTVKNLAIRTAAVGMIPQDNDAGFDTDRYLLHSLGCAEVARMVAQKLGDADPIEAYIAGLLHDFGKILFALYLPQAFRDALDDSSRDGIPLHEAERSILGVDHTHAGEMLAAKWQFPASLVEAIRDHHEPPPAGGLGRCLFLANELVKERGFGDAGNPRVAPLPPALAPSLGPDYAGVGQSLAGLAEKLEQVMHYAEERSEM